MIALVSWLRLIWVGDCLVWYLAGIAWVNSVGFIVLYFVLLDIM